MSVQAGRRLGRYEIISLLGAGGMGQVFEAEDTALGRRVAIKVLPPMGLDADSVERSAVEARAIARLSHPNILTIHDFSMADGTPFAVMELLEGRTLRAVLDAGGLALHTALDYATQLAHGLAAAHAKDIAHRDIKPENIFITRDGLVKVLDFGIAAMGLASSRSAPAVIAREQVQADRKEDVLRHLGAATTHLRRTLGESLPSIRKFDAPIEQATTSSLEALRVYALGVEQANRGQYRESVGSFQRATELDEHFALAYQGLAKEQFNTNGGSLFEDAASKAYALRGRTTESESLRISAFYHLAVTRNLPKAIEIAESWRQTYPDRWEPHSSLSDLYYSVGRYDEAVGAAREAIRMNPRVAPSYSNLAGSLVHQDRFAEARAVYDQAAQRGLDAPEFHFFRFWIASWLGETAGQRSEIAWFDRSAQPQLGALFQSQIAGFAGRWREWRGLTLRAIEIADQAGQRAAGTRVAADKAATAAALGDCATARSLAARALSSSWPTERAQAALALAMCRETARAEAIMERLAADGPEDTILQSIWVPTVRAATALAANQPARAVRELARTRPYDRVTIWPAWLRGQALFRAGTTPEAIAEFQKLRDNRGQYDWAYPLYPLAHLGLARAAVRANDLSLARQEYGAFLDLWKNADSDAAPLIDARREYARISR
jgi:eukaryotic-like serine/threonine-protein kinase